MVNLASAETRNPNILEFGIISMAATDSEGGFSVGGEGGLRVKVTGTVFGLLVAPEAEMMIAVL